MAASLGRTMILGVETTPSSGTYTDIGSSISTSMTINNTSVDITDIDSGGWTELLEGAGEQSVSVSLNGILKSEDGEALLEAAAEANDLLNYQLSYGSKTATGKFHIDSFESAGEIKNAITFTASLSSSGTITFA